MPAAAQEPDFPIDYFVSRRGAAGDVAVEVAEVLESAGYKVCVQDFDIPLGANFVAAMHDALKSARHFVGLLTEDYDSSVYTREEWTSFFALSRTSGNKRRLAVLRIEEVEPPGLFASIVYGDLVGVTNRQKRREIILATAEGRSVGRRRGNHIFHGVPPRNPDFTGRISLLAALHEKLDSVEKPAAITQATQAAIYGLGGVGKTSLAIEYTHLHIDDYAGIWWAAAENRTILIANLAELAGVLDSRLANEPNAEKAARAALATLANHERPWLLVYDNVADPHEIRDLRPSKGAKLLITTRHPDWGGYATELEIDVLEPSEATEFLLRRTDRTDSKGAADLAATLGYLPLALDHAGAYVVSAAINFDEYTRRYQELITKAPKGSLSTAATFDLAIKRAKELDENSEKLLGVFCVLAPERIPLDLIGTSVISEHERDEAMGALFTMSLIRKDNLSGGGMAVSVHRLVRTAMRARLAAAKKLAYTLTTATAQLISIFPREELMDPKLWPLCDRLLPHALELSRDLDNRSKYTVTLLQAAGTFLQERGAYIQGEQACRDGIALAEKLFGRKHVAYAVALHTFARTFHGHGRILEGEAACREAIKIFGNRDDESLAIVLDTLGGLLNECARNTEAELYHRRAISILRKKFGPQNRRIAGPLMNASSTLLDLGRFSEAEQLLREGITIASTTFGRESYFLVNANHNLATLLLTAGRAREAETIARDSIAETEKLYGRKHLSFALSLVTLAMTLRNTDRAPDAEPLLREAIEIIINTVGSEHVDLGFARASLSKLLATDGRQAEALEEVSQSLDIHNKSLCDGVLRNRRYAIELSDALDLVGRKADGDEIRLRYGLAPKPAAIDPP